MKKIKENWDLALLYKNGSDPQIEKDLVAAEKAFISFEKKYKGKDFTSTPQKLLTALKDGSRLDEALKGSASWWYFALRKDLNSDDKEAGSKMALNNERLTKARNRITFFPLEIAKIPQSHWQKYLKAPVLKEYRYMLKTIFDKAKHTLSEQEEQLVSLLTPTSYGKWVEGQNKLLSQQLIRFKGADLTIEQATSRIPDLPKKDRDLLQDAVNKKLIEISHFAEAEMNAVYNFKKVMDERRGYTKPYSATVLGCENDEKTVENLVNLVTKNFRISHRFYKLKAKLIGEKKLAFGDRSAKTGEVKKKFNFPSSIEIVKRAFAKIDSKYPDILDAYLERGQIDVYPRKGKKGGAYCWGNDLNPTFVLLNHSDSIRSVETLAHEMGHAFHSEFAKTQPIHYRGYSTAVAEVASTFFEQVVVDELEHELGDKERILLLHNKIQGDIATIFRQIACFNFEFELHTRVGKEGELPKEEIAKLMQKHMKTYLGPVTTVTEEDGYSFVSWWHLRRFFYVYSYAYGQIISRALFEKWKEDKSYAKKIEQFLSAGSSMSPENIFKSIGIDTSDPKFFETGLKAIEKDIAKLEKLAKK